MLLTEHMRNLILLFILLMFLLITSSKASTAECNELIKVATTRPWGGENYPALPSLSTEMQGLVCGDIVSSLAVRNAYIKLDTKRRNVEWFQGVAELEKLKASWALQSCLIHPSEDVQIFALNSLERIKDKRSIPFLLIYADYMAVFEAGSENATIHGGIHQSVASTLSTLTGIKIEIKGQDPEALKQGIKKWRNWMVKNDSAS